MQLYTKTLYKRHSNGTLGDYVISVTGNDDGTASIVRRYTKVIGGKPVIATTVVNEGKNIGKSNETTAYEQAVFEAESIVRKQLDKGYTEHKPERGTTSTNALGFRQPMLAQPIEKVKDWKFPVLVQPKLDGHRLLATVSNEKVVLYSRQGKVVECPHIQQELQMLYDEGYWLGQTLDGEIYKHGLPLQTISSLVKKYQKESEELEYFIYDIMVDSGYSVRQSLVTSITSNISLDKVKALATELATTQTELDSYHALCISVGYEGTMVRGYDSLYEEGKRSKNLMKIKDFKDDEFEVVGWKLGKPDIRPDFTYQRPVFECVTKEGVLFDCTCFGTMQERHEMYEKGLDNYIGKMLTVKYFNYTPDKVPYLPIALRFREDI